MATYVTGSRFNVFSEMSGGSTPPASPPAPLHRAHVGTYPAPGYLTPGYLTVR
jgi:hypothetical protein